MYSFKHFWYSFLDCVIGMACFKCSIIRLGISNTNSIYYCYTYKVLKCMICYIIVGFGYIYLTCMMLLWNHLLQLHFETYSCLMQLNHKTSHLNEAQKRGCFVNFVSDRILCHPLWLVRWIQKRQPLITYYVPMKGMYFLYLFLLDAYVAKEVCLGSLLK